MSSQGDICFDRPTYYGFDETPTITLNDINLNASPTQIDSYFVEIKSGIDPAGIKIPLYENGANSGQFSGSFNLGKYSINGKQLRVAAKDSLIAIYQDAFPEKMIMVKSYFIDTTQTAVRGFTNAFPLSYHLDNAYPNPFNPSVFIQYHLPERSHVTLKIFNSVGEKIKTLVDEKQGAGDYVIKWNGADDLGRKVVSGIYFYKFKAQGENGKFIKSKKMVLLR